MRLVAAIHPPEATTAILECLGLPARAPPERLRLEPLAPGHAGALHRIYAEPGVADLLFTRPRSREEFASAFDRALRFGETHGMWAVFARGREALLGRVGFFAFGEEKRPELVFLLSRSAWGRGLATEACARALEHAVRSRPWSEVVALVRPGNVAAVRVVEKVGFAPESDLLFGGEEARLYRASRSRIEAWRPTSGRSGPDVRRDPKSARAKADQVG